MLRLRTHAPANTGFQPSREVEAFAELATIAAELLHLEREKLPATNENPPRTRYDP